MTDRNMAIGTAARTEPGSFGIGDVIALDPPCAPNRDHGVTCELWTTKTNVPFRDKR